MELEQPPAEIACCAHRAGAGRDLRFVVVVVAQDVPAGRRVSGAAGTGVPASASRRSCASVRGRHRGRSLQDGTIVAFVLNVVMASPSAPPGSSRCSCMRGLSDLEDRVVVPAVQSAGSGSSHTAAYSPSSSLSPEASARASLTPSGLAASSAASASSRIVSGSRPTSSAAASLFGSSLIRSAAAYRRNSFLSLGGALSFSAAISLTCSATSVRTVSSTRSAYCWCAGLATAVAICWLVARVHAEHRDRAHRFLVLLGRLFEKGCAYPAAPADVPGVLPERFPEAFDRGVELLADARFVVRHGWISSRSGRFREGGFSLGRRVPIVLDRGRSGAPHSRSCGGDLDDSDRLCGGRMSCWMSASEAGRLACSARLSGGAPRVVEVWSLDAVRAVCGVGRFVGDRCNLFVVASGVVPILVSGPVLRLRARCRSLAGRCLSAGRPDGRPVDAVPGLALFGSGLGPAFGWGCRCQHRWVCHGDAMRRLELLAAVEAVRCAGSVTGRVEPRALFGARRDSGLAVQLLDRGLLDIVSIPALMAALMSFRLTAGSHGVLLDALALRGAPRVSEDGFEGEIAPLDEELGPRRGQ